MSLNSLKERIASYNNAMNLVATRSGALHSNLQVNATEADKPVPAIPPSFLEKLKQKARQALATDALADDSVASLPEDYFDPDDSSDAVAYEDEIENESADSAANKAESFSLSITLNEKQLLAKETALSGKSFCLIGAAGTGKTTTQREVALTLLESSSLSTTDFKHPSGGAYGRVSAPSIAFCAFTRRATSNLRRAIHKNPALEETLKNNILTIHQLLEYEPETYFDYAEGKEKFRFAPKKTAKNPLTITHLVIEEASMIGIDLWEKLYDAMPAGLQIIFIGDINQLPPVFGPSILNYALVQLPVVELTEVYRNQGIVLENAHNILSGKTLATSENYQIIEGKNNFGQEKQSMALGNFFKAAFKAGQYDPDRHMILTPWNKNFLGSDNMNKHISQFLGEQRSAVVHEVIAGFNKLYLAEGDKVMVNKMDGVIVKIEQNPAYIGKAAQVPGTDLTRFGFRIVGASNGALDTLDDLVADYENFNLESLEEEKMERKLQASHRITIRYNDSDPTETLSAVGDFGPQVFSLGYVLTVHKSQGSEWDKVFIIFHKEHAVSLYRELFYTAATRARTDVCIIAKKDVVEKAIKTQRIKGNSLKDKLEFFNSGVTTVQTVYCTK